MNANMMEQLLYKFEQGSSFTNAEVKWLVNHLSDVRPEIRDDLCYTILAKGIINRVFTKEQIRWIADDLYQNNRLFQQMDIQGEATLGRSFVALVWGILLGEDGSIGELLTEDERMYAFKSAIAYLQLEKDYRGYDECYGWVHAIAHGADLLSAALSHPNCLKAVSKQSLNVVTHIFNTATSPFIDEEEQRLGMAIVAGIHAGNVTQLQLVEWMKAQSFDLLDGTNIAYYRWTMYKHFLASIYFRLESEQLLEDELRREMMDVLMDY